MKKKVKLFLFLSLTVVGILFTDCVLMAQSVLSTNQHWTQTSCPSSPKALIVHDGYLFAGSEDGVVRSSNDGNTWVTVNSGLVRDQDPPPVLSFCSFSDRLLVGGDYGAGTSLSTNDGNNWKTFGTSQRVTSFVVHDNYIFGSTATWSMVRSTDSGATWQFPDTTYGEMTFMHSNDNISCVSVAANSNFVFGGSDDGNIYRSSNNGDHWERAYTDSTLNPLPMDVSAISTIGSTVIAEEGANLIRSTNNGDNWEVVLKNGFGVRTFMTWNNIFFAGGYFGVFYSSDDGLNWSKASDGLPDSIAVDALAIQDGYLFAGAYAVFPISAGGVWKTPLSDFTNAVRTNDISKPSPIVSIMRENIQFSNVDNDINKITFYNAVGQVCKEIKNIGASFEFPTKGFSSGFYEVVFSSKGIVKSISRVVISK